MDQDIFPNPVLRNDLPVRRRRWPRLLLIFGVFFFLVIAFLPQILATPVGRKFAVTYIAQKTQSSVVLEQIRTSWFGGTTIRQLWVKDSAGRRMGCRSLVCKASLLDLLRGKWSLGDATVEGLYVDYMINNGRGIDSFDVMDGVTAAPATPVPSKLPRLSGNIQIANGTLVLWRGTVQPHLYDTTWEAVRFTEVKGTLKIPSLDQNCSFELCGSTADEGKPTGTLMASGTIDFGAGGRLDPKAMSFDIHVAGKDVHIAAIAATIIPGAVFQDVRNALGEILTSLEVAARAADGKIEFTKCSGSGPSAEFQLKPAIDLARAPAQLTLEAEQNRIKLGISRPLAQRLLALANPFFREAVPGQGQVDVAFEQLALPLTKAQWTNLTARGSLSARAVVLARNDEIVGSAALPDNLASQLALFTGDSEPTIDLQADGPFVIGDSRLAIPPMSCRIGMLQAYLEGTTLLETGQISMVATLLPAPALRQAMPSLGDSTISIPLNGTIRQPRLNPLAIQGKLSDEAIKDIGRQVNQQVARMQSKENQRIIQRSHEKVQELLRSLPGPATGSATRP